MNRLNVARVVEGTIKVVGTDKDRISMVIGISLGMSMPVTEQDNKNPLIYFNRTFGVHLRDFISAFNERFLINTETAYDIAKCVWEYRYKMVNFRRMEGAQNVICATNPIVSLLSGFGLGEQDIDQISACANTQTPNIAKCFEEIFHPKAE